MSNIIKRFGKRWGGSAVAEGYGGTRQGEAFHPPFYLLSHWRTLLSIPTFGFCKAKNESYIKRFGKRWGGGRAGIKSDKSDKMPVNALNKSYSPPSFFLQKESKQRKNTHYLYIFLQHCPMQITAPAAPLTVVARRAYPSPLNAARPSSDSLRSPTPGVPPAFLLRKALTKTICHITDR